MVPFLAMVRSFVTAVRRGLSDPTFRALASLVLVLLAGGTVFYWRVEGWSILDSLYFSVITLTTVGYGDLAPSGGLSKVFTMVYVLLGLGVLVSFVSVVASHAVDARVEQKEAKNRTEGGSGGEVPPSP